MRYAFLVWGESMSSFVPHRRVQVSGVARATLPAAPCVPRWHRLPLKPSTGIVNHRSVGLAGFCPAWHRAPSYGLGTPDQPGAIGQIGIVAADGPRWVPVVQASGANLD
jgi:hypothetical protein